MNYYTAEGLGISSERPPVTEADLVNMASFWALQDKVTSYSLRDFLVLQFQCMGRVREISRLSWNNFSYDGTVSKEA